MSLLSLLPKAATNPPTPTTETPKKTLPTSEKKDRNLGPAVEKGVINYTSVSAIKKFDPSQEGGCHRAWHYRYVQRIKEPETEAMRKGTEFAATLEHYLKTSEDVLPPVLRAGKHLLPVPGPDLEVEQLLGDIEKAIALRKMGATADLVLAAAGLTANDVPLTGAADCRHRRGEYVDGQGEVRKEYVPLHTAEIIDHKTTKDIARWSKSADALLDDVQMNGYAVHASNIYPDVVVVRLSHVYYQTQGRPQGKKVTVLLPVEDARRKWERVSGVVRQMGQVALIKDVSNVEPNLRSCDAFRGCFYASQCPKSPEQTVFDLGNVMQNRLASPSTNQGAKPMSLLNRNLSPAASTSPPNGAVVSAPVTQAAAPATPAAGSLLSRVQKPATDAAPTTATAPDAAQRAAQIETEKARLLAEEKAWQAQQQGQKASGTTTPAATPAAAASTAMEKILPSEEEMPVTACDPEKKYFVTVDGKPMLMTYKGTAKDAYIFLGEDGKTRAKLTVADDVREAVTTLVEAVQVAVIPKEASSSSIGKVNPPDGDGGAPVAEALPPEEVAKISDPELRARAEALAAETAKREAQAQAEKDAAAASSGAAATTGRCPGGNKRIVLTADVLAAQRVICACGKEYKTSKLKMVKEGGDYVSTMPSHNRLAPTEAAAPAATTPAAQPATTVTVTATPAPAADPRQMVIPGTIPEATQPAQQAPLPLLSNLGNVVLFIDCVTEGISPTPLEDYYLPLVRKLEEMYSAADLRCAPADGPLGFGRWKGALAAYVRATKIPAGIYGVRTGDEVADVVVREILNQKPLVVRGSLR